MSKTAVFGLALILFALDWAALDDITTGKENSHFLEYIILLVSVFIFGFLGYRIFRRKS